jgi:UDP-N-acetylmuramyl pentapeptide phosphotransferase/UDP-N-acetylglucosamine-1-phosphate transferase
MIWVYVAGLFCLICVCSFISTKAVIAPLRRRALLDLPNKRSSHTTPTPRGGGLAVMASLLGALTISGMLNMTPPTLTFQLILLLLFLATVSWVDDLQNLGALVRFASHIMAVATALYMGSVSGPFFNNFFDPTVGIILIGLGWVWFINLFNFMDGIDGMAGIEAISIGLGGTVLIFYGDGNPTTAIIGLLLAASTLGFLPSNWNPAKIFMGDVGSIPLGFLCAWVLLSLAAQGMGAAGFILSLVFSTDATVTLFKRLIRGEKIWKAHNQHFYQRAVQRGLSHSQTTLGVVCANVTLTGIALWSIRGDEFLAVFAGLIVVGLLFIYYLKFPISDLNENSSP